MKKLIIMLLAACAMGAGAIETSIAYQGVLRDAQGQKLTTKSHMITFRLYTQASGGTAIWGRALSVNLDDEGLFNVELKDDGAPVDGATYAGLAAALASARGGTLYVGLEVADSSGEIQPRQKIIMTPYASWAADVTAATGDFSVGGKATLSSADVTGNLSVAGRTTLGGDVVFNNNVTVAGGINVRNTGTLSGYGTIPIGGIIMWSGRRGSIPDGWALCNGSNGTPDLRGKFIMGVSNLSESDSTGGRENVTLSVGNLPAHNHMYAGDDHVDYIHDSNYNAGNNVVSRPGGYDATSSNSGLGTIYRTSNTGSGQAFSILPPYYKLAFIMRVK